MWGRDTPHPQILRFAQDDINQVQAKGVLVGLKDTLVFSYPGHHSFSLG